MTAPGPAPLGRSVVVDAGSPNPSPWDDADRVVIDAALLDDPDRLLSTVDESQRRYVRRTPTVYV
ncbi:MAG: hypothetical protein ACRDXF_11220, partial [Acidimicrobiia bacterium]